MLSSLFLVDKGSLHLCSEVSKNAQIGSMGLMGRKEMTEPEVVSLVLMWHILGSQVTE